MVNAIETGTNARWLWDLPLDHWPETAWSLLADSLDRPGDPLRYPAVATAGEDGPRLRVVVLRQVLAAERRLRFYTDRRSPKVAELAARPRLSWVFHDPLRRLQIRAEGPASLHGSGDVAQRAWLACDRIARSNYQGSHAPGTVIESPGGEWMAAADAPGAGREHFTVICGRVDTMDVLLLGREGNRRLVLDWRDAGWRCNWVAP